MTELDSRFVKRGLWVNLDRGPVMGRTITTDVTTGNIIISLLTLLTSLAITQFWELITFAYHQSRAEGTPSDGLFRQQQAILRSLPTPPTLATYSIKLWWKWRKTARRPFVRSMLPFLLSILVVVITTMSGTSTAFIVTTSDLEVLVSSPHCGALNITKAFGRHDLFLANWWGKLQPIIEAYGRDCFNINHNLAAACPNTFHRSNISLTTESSTCPWNSSMCASGPTPAISLDTDLLDMNDHFGFNLKEDDRVKFRKKTTCNVLSTLR